MNFSITPNTEVKLLSEKSQLVKELVGFSKKQTFNATSSRQLELITRLDIESDLDARFNALRTEFGFKRRELSVAGPIDCAGTISTPAFRYHITVEIDESDSSRVIWRRMISDVVDAPSVFSNQFQRVFNDEFKVLEIKLESPLEVETIIDRLEEGECETIQIDYDRNATWCEIKISAVACVVRIEDEAIRVISSKSIAPRDLVSQFYEVQKQFGGDATLHPGEIGDD